ncbi:terminase small subunit-like protein [Leeia aquatica]|uniref:Terminase small subunit n=1 Tax=Leeia aquatica TaxID=2725557 RepID=A0A847RWQ3_9NEIS|nr:terminase small subunit [Leeia aquatica]NLR74221.1 terminase small subunit [Leeia aquatica]
MTVAHPYDPALAARVCAGLAEGLPLARVCRKRGLPALAVVLGWLQSEAEFRQQYQLARSVQLDALAEDMVEIADAAQGLDNAGVAAAKLRVEVRKWRAAQLAQPLPSDGEPATPSWPLLDEQQLDTLRRELAEQV